MAYLLRTSNRGSHVSVDVDRDSVCSNLVFSDRDLLRGNGKTLSWYGKFLLFCGASLPESRQGLALCPPVEIHRGLGLALVLLDLSRRHGRGYRNLRWLCCRNTLSKLHERI